MKNGSGHEKRQGWSQIFRIWADEEEEVSPGAEAQHKQGLIERRECQVRKVVTRQDRLWQRSRVWEKIAWKFPSSITFENNFGMKCFASGLFGEITSQQPFFEHFTYTRH